jgi:hypothetical protein
MPRGDRTGPGGMGPMTGRGAGYCAGYGMPGFANPGFGRGFGFGRGGGRGFGGGGWGRRNRFYATGIPGWMGFGGGYAAPYYPAPDAETEKQALKNEAKAVREELEAIDKRLAELEAGTGSKSK